MEELLGKVFTEGRQQLNEVVEQRIQINAKTSIITANPEIIMKAVNDRELRSVLLNQDVIITPDGVGVTKAYKYLFGKKVEKIPGIETVLDLIEIANKDSLSLFVYGASEASIVQFKRKVSQHYTGINSLTVYNGFDYDLKFIKNKIIEISPDIILVGIGVPRQEFFIDSILREVNKGIFIGCGGSLDIVGGHKRRAPKVFLNLNMEWLYRIVVEPKRLIRFKNNQVRFGWIVLKKKVSRSLK